MLMLQEPTSLRYIILTQPVITLLSINYQTEMLNESKWIFQKTANLLRQVRETTTTLLYFIQMIKYACFSTPTSSCTPGDLFSLVISGFLQEKCRATTGDCSHLWSCMTCLAFLRIEIFVMFVNMVCFGPGFVHFRMPLDLLYFFLFLKKKLQMDEIAPSPFSNFLLDIGS